MSVSGISSSNLSNYQSSNIQNQQQWLQQLQELGQALQSGSSSTLQNTAQTSVQTQLAALPTAASSAASSTPSSTQSSDSASPVPVQGSPKHGHGHHHFRVDAGGDNNNDSNAAVEPVVHSRITKLLKRATGLRRMATGLAASRPEQRPAQRPERRLAASFRSRVAQRIEFEMSESWMPHVSHPLRDHGAFDLDFTHTTLPQPARCRAPAMHFRGAPTCCQLLFCC